VSDKHSDFGIISTHRNETDSTTPIAADLSTRHDNAICVRGSPPPLAARAEKANVFFIHGANVSE